MQAIGHLFSCLLLCVHQNRMRFDKVIEKTKIFLHTQ